MVDEKKDDAAAAPKGPIAGSRLRKIREEKDLKLEDLARDLHVDQSTLTAIEENRFSDLGAPVFAKGHLRKYAEALGVSTADILAEYYQVQQSTELPPVVSERKASRHSFYAPPWMYALAITFLALALLVWWFVAGNTPEPTPVIEAAGLSGAAEQPATDSVASGIATPSVNAGGSTDTPAVTSAAVVPVETAATRTEAPVTRPPSREPALPRGQGRVVLEFSGECWTEIRDANNRRLFSAVGNAGDRRVLQGALPFSVIFGNARAVDLTVNGSAFAIPASARRGRTARFQIPAQ